MAALEKQLAKEQAAVQDKLAEAKDQLDTLKDEERAELLASRSGDVRIPSNVPASGRAAIAVRCRAGPGRRRLRLRRRRSRAPTTAPA